MSGLPVGDEAEFVVVGAGPAGATAALTLAGLGREVIIIDKDEFPRDKPCGDGLWSGAVEKLSQFGLDHLVEAARPIHGVRFVRDEGVTIAEHSATTKATSTLARCIPRVQLDQALLSEAISRGARFANGWVDNLHENNGQVDAIEMRRRDGRRESIRASKIIAADGATSRLRRVCRGGRMGFSWRAYAARVYVRTECVLDPFFEVRLPLRHEGALLPGYSWVFPVNETTANVGLGYYIQSKTGNRQAPSILEVFDNFVDDLREDRSNQYGDIEVLSELRGAPVAINYSSDDVEYENVTFVGDAAQMTDPLIGEGIHAALVSGETAAKMAVRSMRHPKRPRFGDEMARRFPNLGQDVGTIIRNYDQFVHAPAHENLLTRRSNHPLMENVLAILSLGAAQQAPPSSVPVIDLLKRCAVVSSDELETFDRFAFSVVHSSFPFTTDQLIRKLWGGVGPTFAAAMWTVATSLDRRLEQAHIDAALAGELLVISVDLIRGIEDDVLPGGTNIGNGISMLISDYAMSQSLATARSLGPIETAMFARLSREAYEAATAESDDAWTLHRTTDRYLAAATHRDGSLHAHAAELSMRLTSKPNESSGVSEYGRGMGIAFRISTDVRELLDGDASTGKRPGEGLRYGRYELPVIYALEEDPSIADLLARDVIEDAREEAVDRIRATNAVDRCAVDCERYADAALAALKNAEIDDPSALHALVQLSVDRCAKEAKDD